MAAQKTRSGSSALRLGLRSRLNPRSSSTHFNMNLSEPKTLLSAEGFNARPELVAHVEAKAMKLRRHEIFQIGHVRLHVRHERPHNGTTRFMVSATAETRGADFVAHSSAGVPESAINSAFDKLERAVAEAAGEWKHNLRQPRPVEMSMALPKAI